MSEDSHRTDMQQDETSQFFAKPRATTLLQSFGEPGSSFCIEKVEPHPDEKELQTDESTLDVMADLAQEISAKASKSTNNMIIYDSNSCGRVTAFRCDPEKVNSILYPSQEDCIQNSNNKGVTPVYEFCNGETPADSVLQESIGSNDETSQFFAKPSATTLLQSFGKPGSSFCIEKVEPHPEEKELQTDESTLNVMADLAQQVFAKASNSTSNMIIFDSNSCGRVKTFQCDPEKVNILYLSQEDCMHSSKKGVTPVYEFCSGGTPADSVLEESIRSNDAKALRVQVISFNGQTSTIYMCSYCYYTNRYRCLLSRHLKSHSDERPHQCKLCGSYFKSMGTLRVHLNSHAGILPHKCESCNISFVNVSGLSRHLSYVHTDKKPLQCNLCDYACVELSKLKRHVRLQHEKLPLYQCDVCKSYFKHPKHMKDHKRLLHSGKRHFPCEFCPAVYRSSRRLKKHSEILHSFDVLTDVDSCSSEGT